MQLAAVPSLAAVDPAAWDALGGADFPFVSHAFLYGLERTGCVGPGTAWAPAYLLLLADDVDVGAAHTSSVAAKLQPLAAAPCYLKGDGRGEYVFDWQWAGAYQRAGLPYYPKLVVAAPFAPANGPKLLVPSGLSADASRALRQRLGDGVWALATQLGASSAHVLLCADDDANALCGDAEGPEAPWHRRATLQYQWHNPGVAGFEGFLDTLRSRARKQLRAERRRARSHGLHLQVEAGDALSAADWRAIADLYRRGCLRYGSTPYLTPAFFGWLAEHLAARVVCGTARDAGGEIVAMTLNFIGRDVLYGRHWGAREDWPMLHFELAYYALIELVAERGLARLEAGSGGDHKLGRGLQPTVCHSAHRFGQAALGGAIAGFLARERVAVEEARLAIAAEGKQRRGEERNAAAPQAEP